MPILPNPGDVLEPCTVNLGSGDDGEPVWATFYLRPVEGPLWDRIVASHIRPDMTLGELDAAAAPDLIAAALARVASSAAPDTRTLTAEEATSAAVELWEGWPNSARATVFEAVKHMSGAKGVARPFVSTPKKPSDG